MKFSKMFELPYCINLDKRPDRWQEAKIELEKVDISPKRFSGVEHSTGWLGCYQSHLKILKEAKGKNKNIFIFEDDVQIVNYEKSIIESAVDELKERDWAMFYLGANPLTPFFQVSEHLAKLSYAHSAHAYGINKEYLETIIYFLEMFGGSVPIDVIYAKLSMKNINSYITVPMLAIQRDSYSNIENKIMTYDIPTERYNQFLVRLKNDKK